MQGPDRFALEQLTGRAAVTGLQAAGKNLGNLELTLTGVGDQVNFALNSGLANAAIKGQGNATLKADYPLRAELTFDSVRLDESSAVDHWWQQFPRSMPSPPER